MALQDDIKNIVETTYPNGTFVLGNKFFADFESYTTQSTEMPFIVLDNTLKKDNSIQPNGNVLKRTQINIWFLDVDKYDNTPTETSIIQTQMEAIADNIYLQILQLSYIRSENEDYTTTRAFHLFNSRLSGVFVQARWSEQTKPSWCPVPPSYL